MKYERLTKIEYENVASINGRIYYEEPVASAIERLAELEDMIEDGTLIELPCKIGETVYRFLGKCGGHLCPYNGEFGQWRCSYKGKRRCDAFVDEIPFELSNLSNIGKNIFLTREEAEEAMKARRY